MTRVDTRINLFNHAFNTSCLTNSQLAMDSACEGFSTQASNFSSIAMMTATSLVGKFAGMGILSLFANQNSMTRNAFFHLGSVAIEGATFSVLSHSNSQSQDSFLHSWAHHCINFGVFRLLGGVHFANQTAQFALQSATMVAAHQASAELGFEERSHQSFAQQFMAAGLETAQMHVGNVLGEIATGHRLQNIHRQIAESTRLSEMSEANVPRGERLPQMNANSAFTDFQRSVLALRNTGDPEYLANIMRLRGEGPWAVENMRNLTADDLRLVAQNAASDPRAFFAFSTFTSTTGNPHASTYLREMDFDVLAPQIKSALEQGHPLAAPLLCGLIQAGFEGNPRFEVAFTQIGFGYLLPPELRAEVAPIPSETPVHRAMRWVTIIGQTSLRDGLNLIMNPHSLEREEVREIIYDNSKLGLDFLRSLDPTAIAARFISTLDASRFRRVEGDEGCLNNILDRILITNPNHPTAINAAFELAEAGHSAALITVLNVLASGTVDPNFNQRLANFSLRALRAQEIPNNMKDLLPGLLITLDVVGHREARPWIDTLEMSEALQETHRRSLTFQMRRAYNAYRSARAIPDFNIHPDILMPAACELWRQASPKVKTRIKRDATVPDFIPPPGFITGQAQRLRKEASALKTAYEINHVFVPLFEAFNVPANERREIYDQFYSLVRSNAIAPSVNGLEQVLRLRRMQREGRISFSVTTQNPSIGRLYAAHRDIFRAASVTEIDLHDLYDQNPDAHAEMDALFSRNDISPEELSVFAESVRSRSGRSEDELHLEIRLGDEETDDTPPPPTPLTARRGPPRSRGPRRR